MHPGRRPTRRVLADWKPVAIDFFQVMGLKMVSAIRGEKKLGIASSPQERRTRRRLTLLTRHASRYSTRATWRPSRCVSFPRLHHPFASRARARGRTADARWRKTLNHRRSLASACFSPHRARDGVANERLTHLIPVPLSQQTEKAYQKQFGVNAGYVPPRRAPIRVTPDPASDFGETSRRVAHRAFPPSSLPQIRRFHQEEGARQGWHPLLQERWPRVQDPQGRHRGCVSSRRARARSSTPAMREKIGLD